jgi:hypothetical protein
MIYSHDDSRRLQHERHRLSITVCGVAHRQLAQISPHFAHLMAPSEGGDWPFFSWCWGVFTFLGVKRASLFIIMGYVTECNRVEKHVLGDFIVGECRQRTCVNELVWNTSYHLSSLQQSPFRSWSGDVP